MMRIDEVLRSVGSDLDRARAPWALIGGFAVSARAEARFTRDVDMAVAVDDDSVAEGLVGDLIGRRYRLLASLEQDATGRLATVRLLPPGAADEGTVVDLLFASSGIEREIAAEAEPLEIVRGLRAPVARTGHLIALKLLSRDDETRPTDAADLTALRAVADPCETERAASAVRLIEERGYARGRDLVAALDALG